MIRRLLASLLGATLLALGACLPNPGAQADESASMAATTGGGPGAGLAIAPHDLPAFAYPERRRLRAEREVTVSTPGASARYRELLHADGDGRFALDLLEVAPSHSAAWRAPTELQRVWHALRQRYLVRYRDLHLGHPTALRQNYDWTEIPGAFAVGGRECRKFAAVSRHGLGEAEFLVDQETDLLLGWTLRNAAGREIMNLRTVALDLEPDLDGVAWPGEELVDDAFDPQAAMTQVGFEPLDPSYLPPGYYLEDERILRTRVLEPALSDLHVAVYHDGVRPLFVAQHRDLRLDNPGTTGRLPGPGGEPLSTIKRSEVHGVAVAEGARGDRRVYVVGVLPMDEIELVAGSALL